jgi:cytochrome c oxidase subunit 2
VDRYWSFLFGGMMLAAFLLFVVSPFVPGWWLPYDVSTFGWGIDVLFYVILGVTGFFFVLTEAILVYALYRFAYKPGHKSQYIHGNHKLELTWALVPGVLLFLLAIVQINAWAEVKFQTRMPTPEGAALQFEVTARQWEWRVRYPSSARLQSWEKDPKLARDFAHNPHEDDVRAVNEIHVWKGDAAAPQKVLVHLKTQDVLHSFFLPNLRLKQDALPGKTIPVWFAVVESNVVRTEDPNTKMPRWIEEGYDIQSGTTTMPHKVWELACAEFCGSRHSLMRGKLYVHESREDWLAWLQQAEAAQRATRPAGPAQTASR